jgi:hypothetical protein
MYNAHPPKIWIYLRAWYSSTEGNTATLGLSSILVYSANNFYDWNLFKYHALKSKVWNYSVQFDILAWWLYIHNTFHDLFVS